MDVAFLLELAAPLAPYVLLLEDDTPPVPGWHLKLHGIRRGLDRIYSHYKASGSKDSFEEELQSLDLIGHVEDRPKALSNWFLVRLSNSWDKKVQIYLLYVHSLMLSDSLHAEWEGLLASSSTQSTCFRLLNIFETILTSPLLS